MACGPQCAKSCAEWDVNDRVMRKCAHAGRVIVRKGDRFGNRVDSARFGAWLLLAGGVARVVGCWCDERFVVKVSGYCVARSGGVARLRECGNGGKCSLCSS